ncbi:hypothetical protein [Priestia megaterium]|uniref:hypothetical protein n=1 Tax=Priestia megaterium TaxID=1404 RepID=UPI002E20CB08|nr:hypothetical protein [Priestia megaterium]
MCNIKLNLSDGDKNMQLEMVDYDKEMLKFVMNKISDVFATSTQEKSEEDTLREGYQILASNKEGLHDPGSEFSVPFAEEKPKKELAAVKPLLQASTYQNTSTPIPTKSSGIKEDGRKQLWYICGECDSKGKHYISSKRTYVTCHECPNEMPVRFADPRGEGYQDEFGNFYIAGEYKKTLKDHEDEIQFRKEKQTS